MSLFAGFLLLTLLVLLCACEVHSLLEAAARGSRHPWLGQARLVAGVLLLVFVLLPRIAFAQANPEPTAPPATLTATQWAVVLLAIVGTFGGLMTAIGEALKLLAMKYPALESTAEHFLALGADFRKAAALSQARTAAKRAAMANANWQNKIPSSSSFPPVPPSPPANGFIEREVLVALGIPGLLLLAGCSFLQAHPKVLPDLQATEKCVEDELVKDAALNDAPLQIGIDLGATCGLDAAKVVLDATTKAQARMGGRHIKAAVLAASAPAR